MNDEAVDPPGDVRTFLRGVTPAPAPAVSLDDFRFLAMWPICLLGARASGPLRARLGKLATTFAPRSASGLVATIGHALGLSEAEAGLLLSRHRLARAELMMELAAARSRAYHPSIGYSGEEHLNRARDKGNGIVLWVSHFAFSSLITKVGLHRLGERVWHISRPQHGFSKSRFGIRLLNPVRCRVEDRYLAGRLLIDRRSPGEILRQATAVLESNGTISTTVGAWEGRFVAEGDLLGGRFVVSMGAPRLAYRTGAALLPVFTLRNDADGSFKLVIRPPVAAESGRDFESYCRIATARLLADHDHMVRAAPAQWSAWKYLQPAGLAHEAV
jgi:lauroyl/myristoyl acyltransferase